MTAGRRARARHPAALGLLPWALPGQAAEPAAGLSYVTEATTVLPSSNTGWDYVTLDQATGRLFIARRADGLTVWDTRTRQVVGAVGNSTRPRGH